MKYTVWTDGCCLKNPGGKGGWAFVVEGQGTLVHRSGHIPAPTTNNRAELIAVIEAVRGLEEGSEILIYTDSQNTISWARPGYFDKKPSRKNRLPEAAALAEELKRLSAGKKIRFQWVRGHSGNKNNELCDEMALEAALGKKPYKPVLDAAPPPVESWIY